MSVDPLLPFAITLANYRRKKVIMWFILAWVFCIGVILCESYFLMLYGLKFGAVKSLMWLSTVLASTFQDFLIMEPLTLILFAILLAYIFKKPHEVSNFQIISEKELKVFSDKTKTKGVSMRELYNKRSQKHYLPLSSSKEYEIRQKYYRLWALKWLTVDLVLLCTYIFMFVVFALNLNIHMLYVTTKHVNKMILNSKGDEIISFYDVKSKTELISYLMKNLVPTLHVKEWYNGLPLEPLDEELTGFTKDYFNKIIGSPRLRQQRIKRKNDCFVDDTIKGVIKKCHEISLRRNEDRETYNGSWTVLAVNDTEDLVSPWKYKAAEEINTVGNWGKSGTYYDGGGYVANLSRSRLRSIVILSDLEDHDWLDNFTRVVLTEFVLYNVNTDVFSLVELIAEHLANGVYITRSQVLSLTLNEKFSISTCVSMIIVLIVVIIMVLRVYYLMQLYGFRNFFFKLRNVLTFASSLLGLILICTWLIQYVLKIFYGKFLQDATSHDFISFYHPVDSEILMDSLLALFTLFVMLQIVFVVTFDSNTKIMRKCLKFSFQPVLLVSLILFIFIIILNCISLVLQNPCIVGYILLINSFNYERLSNNLILNDNIFLPTLITVLYVIFIFIIRAIIIYYYTISKYHYTFHLLNYKSYLVKAFLSADIHKCRCPYKNPECRCRYLNPPDKVTDKRLRGGMDCEYVSSKCNSNVNIMNNSAHSSNRYYYRDVCKNGFYKNVNVIRLSGSRLREMRISAINFLHNEFHLK